MLQLLVARASADKFSGEGANGKKPKISKQYRKIALFSLFQERGRGATEKKTKK